MDRNETDRTDQTDRTDRSSPIDEIGEIGEIDETDRVDEIDEIDQIDPAAPLRSDDEITQRIALLIGRAYRRQLWLLFLDDHSRMLPTLMPNDELPSPLGAEPAAAIAAMLRQAIAGTPIESVILVWERPGGPIANAADKQSAAELAWACADAGVPVRSQLISHDFGVRALSAEEFTPLADLEIERAAG
ncbi:hypothetical protein ACFOYW_01625 [Gryllotalpicola reticulitermitis]|uniref:RadC-like JAB domain-containing protein n=1 Tax=Gryllotalpicola reticulitermitis TaxID=1184153 RepID=A0ABV8Q287_9MICO